MHQAVLDLESDSIPARPRRSISCRGICGTPIRGYKRSQCDCVSAQTRQLMVFGGHFPLAFASSREGYSRIQLGRYQAYLAIRFSRKMEQHSYADAARIEK